MLTLHSTPPECSILLAVSASQSLQMNFYDIALFLIVIVDASKCITNILTHIPLFSMEVSTSLLNKDEATDTSEGWPVALLISMLSCSMIDVHHWWKLFDCPSSTLSSFGAVSHFDLSCSALAPRRCSLSSKESGGCVTVVSCQLTARHMQHLVFILFPGTPGVESNTPARAYFVKWRMKSVM